MIRDEVYRIGREGLVNAFRHSGATHVELELEYGARELHVLVRDDGRGIDPQVVRGGSDGHWGITGMRERAAADRRDAEDSESCRRRHRGGAAGARSRRVRAAVVRLAAVAERRGGEATREAAASQTRTEKHP